MRKFFLILVITAVAIFLCANLAVYFYKIKEPLFLIPVELKNPGVMPIRNDAYGDGNFKAKRNGKRRHNGIDILARRDAPVYASKSGWAVCKNIPTGYGKLIIIYHPDGYSTRYGHLSKFMIRSKQWVNQGRVIGLVGKTGNAAYRKIRPHLHFEIRDAKDTALDPMEYLTQKEGL